jgi:hypothetical protein
VVDVGRDLHPRAADADDALDDVLDAGLQPGLGGFLRALGRGGAEALGVGAGGQGAVGGVGQGDLLGLHIGHRGGDDVADGLDLGAGQLAARHADDHRGGGIGGLGLEQFAARQGDHHPRGLDAAHGHDGARQLAFEGALLIEVLLELGLAQHRLVVEDFVADAARGHEPLARHQHAGLAHLVAADEDRRAVALGAVFDAGAVQRGGDFRGFTQVEVGIQQGVGA